MQDARFATLSQLLVSAEPSTQGTALHGLGHLRHPEGNQRIATFLARRRGIEAGVREYAERILAGHIL